MEGLLPQRIDPKESEDRKSLWESLGELYEPDEEPVEEPKEEPAETLTVGMKPSCSSPSFENHPRIRQIAHN
jgi:hypothetical protein